MMCMNGWIGSWSGEGSLSFIWDRLFRNLKYWKISIKRVGKSFSIPLKKYRKLKIMSMLFGSI